MDLGVAQAALSVGGVLFGAIATSFAFLYRWGAKIDKAKEKIDQLEKDLGTTKAESADLEERLHDLERELADKASKRALFEQGRSLEDLGKTLAVFGERMGNFERTLVEIRADVRELLKRDGSKPRSGATQARGTPRSSVRLRRSSTSPRILAIACGTYLATGRPTPSATSTCSMSFAPADARPQPSGRMA